MTRRVLLIEDEPPAMARLASLLAKVDREAEVVGRVGRVDDAIAWLAEHDVPDLILADIRLEDGLSLKVFEQADTTAPVVFTTAYDAYWTEALASHGVDYLLKPVSEEALARALAKVDALDAHFSRPWRNLVEELASPRKHRVRLLARKGLEHVVVPVGEVAWLTTEHKLTYLVDRDGRRLMVDATLAELEDGLDPRQFFRLNRQVLAHVDAVARFQSAGKGRVAVTLRPHDTEAVVSQERAGAFRAWIEGAG